MGLVFAGYGLLIALVVNRFVLDGAQGWVHFLVVVFLSGVLGAIGHRIGERNRQPLV
jgi:hypothetical protein